MASDIEVSQFDVALGFRLKKLRQMRRVSQEFLGNQLGVTFQQIQRYESGANRIPPERIQKCAEVLNVPVSYFFDSHIIENLESLDKRIVTLAAAIANLPSEDLQKHVYNLIQGITETFTKYDDSKKDNAA